MDFFQEISKSLYNYLKDSNEIEIYNSSLAPGEIIKFVSKKETTIKLPGFREKDVSEKWEIGFEMTLRYKSDKRLLFYDYKIIKDQESFPLSKAFFEITKNILKNWENVIRDVNNFKSFRDYEGIRVILTEMYEEKKKNGEAYDYEGLEGFLERTPLDDQINYVISVFKQDENKMYKFFDKYIMDFFLTYKMLFKSNIKLIIDFTKKTLEDKIIEKNLFFSEMENIFVQYLFTNGEMGKFFVHLIHEKLFTFSAKEVIDSFVVYNGGRLEYEPERWWDSRNTIGIRNKRTDKIFRYIIEMFEESVYYEFLGTPRIQDGKEVFFRAFLYETADMFLHKDFPLGIIDNRILLSNYISLGPDIDETTKSSFEELLFYMATEQQTIQKNIHRNATILNVIRRESEKYKNTLSNEEIDNIFIEGKSEQIRKGLSFYYFIFNQIEKYPYTHNLSRQNMVNLFVTAAQVLRFLNRFDIYGRFYVYRSAFCKKLESVCEIYADLFLKEHYSSLLSEIYGHFDNDLRKEIFVKSIKKMGSEIIQSPAKAIAVYGILDKPETKPVTYEDFVEYKKTRIINRINHLKEGAEELKKNIRTKKVNKGEIKK